MEVRLWNSLQHQKFDSIYLLSLKFVAYNFELDFLNFIEQVPLPSKYY